MSRRHHSPHDFVVGEEVTVHSGFANRTPYPGVVTRITPTRVHVTYDASSTGGRPAIKKEFYGSSGSQVGGFSGSPVLGKRKPEHEA